MEGGTIRECMIALVQGLKDHAVSAAVISPGSRNAPILSALFNSGIPCYSVIDERSAAFIALGIAQQSGAPVVLVCTSGTALLNYYPALAEAYYARIPLLVLSADRPSHLIDQWDGQCIRQQGVFSNHIRAEFRGPEKFTSPAIFSELASEACKAASHPVRGPVHLNIALEEPLYFEVAEASEYRERVKAAVTVRGRLSFPLPPDELLRDLRSSERPLILQGYGTEHVLGFVEQAPVFADILVHTHVDTALNQWDACLSFAPKRLPPFPDLVISTGSYVVSKGLKTFLRSTPGLKQWHLSEDAEVGDPFFTKPKHWKVQDSAVTVLIDELGRTGRGTEYSRMWQSSLDGFRKHLQGADWDVFTEFGVMHKAFECLKGRIHLGNSMPIRYASYLDRRKDKLYYSNRGTSGIDGSVSTAVGHALSSGEREFLLVGDLSFFYDANALFNRLSHRLQVLVLNNGGGRIFELLPGHEKLGEAAVLQTTPHTRSAEWLARDHGWNYSAVWNYQALESALDDMQSARSPGIWEVFTDPALNAAFYRSLIS